MRRSDICLYLGPADRAELQALLTNRNTPRKLAWRADIVLATADGEGTVEIMRRTGMSKPTVWRWQERYLDEGVPGLKRDKTRPSRVPPLPREVRLKVIAKTVQESPPNATHWSRATMAEAVGISASSVGRIWADAGLKPHIVKGFKVSNDPMFEAKVTEIVGLYLDPPDRAVVLCVDEKSQIQALDRTQPGLPLKKGRAATMTHDAIRQVIEKLEAIPPTIEGNRDMLAWLRGERQWYDEGEKRHRHVQLIDFERPGENVFHVTWEWKLKPPARKGNRADVMFVINGVPVCIVEHKNPKDGGAIDRAVTQLKRYEKETPELIGTPQLFNVTHLLDYWYGVTWNANRRYMARWKQKPEDWFNLTGMIVGVEFLPLSEMK